MPHPAQTYPDDETVSNDNGPCNTDEASLRTADWRLAYERKFSDFLFLIHSTHEELIVVHHPQVLGDNYEELVESLNRLADAGKRLAVVPRRERD
jgi:hypothetical protein